MGRKVEFMKHEIGWAKAWKWFAEDFAGLRLLELKDREWDQFKEEMHSKLFPGQPRKPGSDYDMAFNRRDAGEAQRNVRGVLERIARRNKLVLKNDPNEHPNNLQQEHYELRLPDAHRDIMGPDGKKLKRISFLQSDFLPSPGSSALRRGRAATMRSHSLVKPLQLYVVIEPDARIWTFYRSLHLPTMIYLCLRDALMLSGITGHILTCDNRDCGKLFLSKRKPRQDRNGHYCSYECCHRESTRRYREGIPNDSKIHEAYKVVERERVAAYPLRKTRSARKS